LLRMWLEFLMKFTANFATIIAFCVPGVKQKLIVLIVGCLRTFSSVGWTEFGVEERLNVVKVMSWWQMKMCRSRPETFNTFNLFLFAPFASFNFGLINRRKSRTWDESKGVKMMTMFVRLRRKDGKTVTKKSIHPSATDWGWYFYA
jgi:hypothetical protein